jgi:hypothetical protein
VLCGVVSTMPGPAMICTLMCMPPSEPPPPYWQQVQTLGVADVVMTILQARKAMPTATAAAVSRASHGKGFRVHVHLLVSDALGEESYGTEGAVAIFIARELGGDLTEAFDGKDVIILK